jgi:hypothetical protein
MRTFSLGFSFSNLFLFLINQSIKLDTDINTVERHRVETTTTTQKASTLHTFCDCPPCLRKSLLVSSHPKRSNMRSAVPRRLWPRRLGDSRSPQPTNHCRQRRSPTNVRRRVIRTTPISDKSCRHVHKSVLSLPCPSWRMKQHPSRPPNY